VSGDTLTGEYDKWLRVTRFCIEKAFGKNHRHIEEFLNLGRASTSDDYEFANARFKQVLLIIGCVEELQIEITTRPSILPDPVVEKVTANRRRALVCTATVYWLSLGVELKA
jgi:hypothetical protein